MGFTQNTAMRQKYKERQQGIESDIRVGSLKIRGQVKWLKCHIKGVGARLGTAGLYRVSFAKNLRAQGSEERRVDYNARTFFLDWFY